jgi:hypothetical protein
MMNYIANIARYEGDPKVIHSGPGSLSSSDRLAKALGWFSLGLGLTELLAPRLITKALGMEGKESLIRAYGAREIGSGLLSLSPDKQAGLWSRVGGDGLDIAMLMTALGENNPKRDNVAIALAMVLGVSVLDLIGAQATAVPHKSETGRRLYFDRSGFPQGLKAAKGAARNSNGTSASTAGLPSQTSAASSHEGPRG